MYTIYLCGFIGFIIGLALLKRSANSHPHSVFSNRVFGPFICSAIGGLLGAVMAMILVRPLITLNEVAVRTETLVSIRTTDGSSGAFVLGSGSFNSGVSYTFYMLNADGSKTPGHVRSSEIVRIYEDASLEANGRWISYKNMRDRSSWLASWAVFSNEETGFTRHEFHVPKGTVVTDFKMN